MIIRMLLAFSLFTVSYSVFALGKVGHQAVCQAAFQQLSPIKQQALQQLLSQASIKDKNLINQYLRLKNNNVISFANACTWADAIKRLPEYDQFKSWHYVNIDRSSEKVDSTSCNQQCITQAIPFHINILQQSTAPLEKVKALMFLGHWLGDIHQPFHVSFASDLGGNRIKVTPYRGKCKNLHWYWDQCLLYPEKHSKTPLNQFWLAEINTLMTTANINHWQDSNPLDWANESLNLVKAQTTKYCEQQGLRCEQRVTSPLVIDQQYHQTNQQQLLVRMAQAATRLAFVLEQVL